MTMKRTKPQDRYNKTSAKQRDIFRDTLFAKNVWRKRGSNLRPTGWETEKISSNSPDSNPGP